MSIVPFLNKVNDLILNPLLLVLFAVATIYFIYSVIRLIRAEGDDKAEARNAVMWGLVGMFVMISVYGIINLVLRTFEVDNPSYINCKLDGTCPNELNKKS